MNHHRVAVAKQFVEFLTSLGILFDNLYVHIVGRSEGCTDRGLVATHHNDVLYVGIVLLTHNFADIWDILLSGHEVDKVSHTQLIETARYDGVFTPFDGYDMVGIIGAAEVAQRLIQYLRRLAQLNAE